ncbi:hypothetical protein [Azospirillum sp. TSO35-2]|uniref:hypothetical protein n=1 Tax=Azospirillum sp. TSO35-2 TaxID=716796 RepID=UPI001304AB64|nr:hypothetical protein [Azospirillum sp. TSO35-2]
MGAAASDAGCVHRTPGRPTGPSDEGTVSMLKIFGWAILIIFIIGLLVVTGILKLVF